MKYRDLLLDCPLEKKYIAFGLLLDVSNLIMPRKGETSCYRHHMEKYI